MSVQKKKFQSKSKDFADHFNREWKIKISRRTIGDILNLKIIWFGFIWFGQSVVYGARTESIHLRSAENVELEKTLFLWFAQMRGKHTVVRVAILKGHTILANFQQMTCFH